MSLGCFECGRGGAFNTLILFTSDGNFDVEKPVSHYSNFYTDCATLNDFKEIKESRFMVVKLKCFQDSVITGTDGDKIREAKHKLVDETTLAAKLPGIFEALLKKGLPVSA